MRYQDLGIGIQANQMLHYNLSVSHILIYLKCPGWTFEAHNKGEEVLTQSGLISNSIHLQPDVTSCLI